MPALGCPHTPCAGAGPRLYRNSVPKTEFLRRLQPGEGLPSTRGALGALCIGFSSNAFSNLPRSATHEKTRRFPPGKRTREEKDPRTPRTPRFSYTSPPAGPQPPPGPGGSDARGCEGTALGAGRVPPAPGVGTDRTRRRDR